MYVDLVRHLREGFDPLVDTLLPHLLKLAGSTKKLVAEASQGVTSAVIEHAACHPRTWVPFLEQGMAERTVHTRAWFIGHVKRYLTTQARRVGGKQLVEGTTVLHSAQGTALASLANLVKRGLTDPNPGVKEEARAAFVVLHREWPRCGEKLLAGLEEGVRRQVDRALAAAAAGRESAAAASTTEQQTETIAPSPSTSAPAPAPPPARRTAARKPSSAIAAAIKKAKEEQRAARLAEAEAEARKKSVDAEREPEADGQREVVRDDGPDGARENGEVREDARLPKSDELPVEATIGSPTTMAVSPPAPQTPVKHETPVKYATPVKQETPVKHESVGKHETHLSHETPIKHVSLLDFQTPNGTSDAFKVMTPAPAKTVQADLLETTGISLPEPVEGVPSSPLPTIGVAETNPESTAAQPEAAPVTSRPRRPRASVNPVAGMDKPKPLYAKLRTLVDCSYWLDRSQGE